MLRKEHSEETGFITLMWIETLDDIKRYAGDNYEKAAVLDRARELLGHSDQNSQH